MAATKMKIKAEGDRHVVLCLASHPMETGLRKDSKTGELVPAHYIDRMEFAHNGKVVAQANLGTAVSKNPLIGIALSGAKSGDTVSVSWTDNKGETGGTEAKVK